jgi:hypothetical protein
MRSLTRSVWIAAATCALIGLVLALAPGRAVAGEFEVASCQADQLSFSTQAFGDFASRGMRIRRACNPEGPGLRGLITANVIQRGRVPRGAVALVTLSAPSGSHLTSFRWAGTARRRDCRYALQLYADGPGMNAIPIKNVRANQHCPRAGHAQTAGYRARTFNVDGATRIVQRVICEGGGDTRFCSARGSNYLRTYKAQAGVVDSQPPTAAIVPDTPLAQGAWVSGSQPLDYQASDNVGVRMAQAMVSGQATSSDQRSCLLATPSGAFADGVPCPNGPGRINVDTSRVLEGTQPLVVQAQDTAGNVGPSPAVTVRIDNTAPARVDVAVDGGEGWRNQNAFAAGWTNPPEGDRAPISAASYKLCPAVGGSCTQAVQTGDNIARLGIQVPGPGEWTLAMWRRDAAGNEDPAAASVPVTLRYDPEPPQVSFEQSSTSDPTLVSALVTDKVSGLADGLIEISRQGSNTWQALATQRDPSHLFARVDDSALPAGTYLLRATAYDQARNQTSTTQRIDGQPMTVTLPLRIESAMRAGVPHLRTLSRTVRRRGKRRHIRRRVTVLRPVARVGFGRHVVIAGRLANRDGQGIANAEVQVFSRSATSAEQLVAVLHTDAEGHYRYTATGSASRILRFAYAGSALILPAQSEVKLHVPALSTLRVSRRSVLNGQTVTFAGRVRSLPVPLGGKLVELQVRLSGRWQTFRTTRSDPAGRWALRYRFERTRGVLRYRFRAALPAEADYSFDSGASRSLDVRVRGR